MVCSAARASFSVVIELCCSRVVLPSASALLCESCSCVLTLASSTDADAWVLLRPAEVASMPAIMRSSVATVCTCPAFATSREATVFWVTASSTVAPASSEVRDLSSQKGAAVRNQIVVNRLHVYSALLSVGRIVQAVLVARNRSRA